MKYELIEYSKTRGGDMLGSYHGISVKKEDGGTVTITVSDSPAHNFPNMEKCYRAEASLLSEIDIIAGKYFMRFWKRRRNKKFLILDAATTSWHFTYSRYKRSFSFSSSHALPFCSGKALGRINAAVEKYITDENLIHREGDFSEYAVCPACGKIVGKRENCIECGSSLDGAEIVK